MLILKASCAPAVNFTKLQYFLTKLAYFHKQDPNMISPSEVQGTYTHELDKSITISLLLPDVPKLWAFLFFRSLAHTTGH